MFRHLKVGDPVKRAMGHNGPQMDMVVVAVDERYIWCDVPRNGGNTMERYGKPGTPEYLNECWRFDRDIGCEEDHDLGWGRKFQKTGTYLVKEEKGEVQ